MWVFILLALFYAYRKVYAGRNLEFDFSLPNQVQIVRGQLVFVQPITLVNHSAAKLTIQAINLAFETEQGAYIGRAALPFSYYLLPAYSSATLPVQVVVNLADLARAVPGLYQQATQLKLSVRYSGTVTAEYLTIPVNEVFTLDKSFFNI